MEPFPFAFGVACFLTGCASTVGTQAAASAPRISADQVSSTVSVVVDAPLSRVFDYVVREDTPQRDLRGYGPIAGVKKDVRLTEGGWDMPALAGSSSSKTARPSTRRSKRSIREDAFAIAFSISARASELSSPRAEVIGDFAAAGNQTRVTWTHVLTAKSCEARPFVRAAVAVFFQPFMEKGIDSIRRHVEHGG